MEPPANPVRFTPTRKSHPPRGFICHAKIHHPGSAVDDDLLRFENDRRLDATSRHRPFKIATFINNEMAADWP